MVVEQRAASGEQIGKISLDLPLLAFRAVAVTRGIEDDAVVAVSALFFANDKAVGVFNNPTDWRAGQVAQRGIAARPCDGALGGVDVDRFVAG